MALRQRKGGRVALTVLIVAAGCALFRDVGPTIARPGDFVRIRRSDTARPVAGWLLVATSQRVVVRGLNGGDEAIPRASVERVELDLNASRTAPQPGECAPAPRRRNPSLHPPTGICARAPHWIPARLPE